MQLKLVRSAAVLFVGRIISHKRAPVAQLDRAPVYETGGYRFEPCRVYSMFQETGIGIDLVFFCVMVAKNPTRADFGDNGFSFDEQ